MRDAYAALANGGTLYSPRIGEAIISQTGQVVKRINPTVIRHLPVAGCTLAYIRNALADVRSPAAPRPGRSAGFPRSQVWVAGKTGTAEVFNSSVTSVFASFAPCNDPKYVVVVMVPKSNFGADVAAPVVRQIYDEIYGLEGHKAALPRQPAARAAEDLGERHDQAARRVRGAVMSLGTRDYSSLRSPSFGQGQRGALSRALAKDSPLRRYDWILVLAVLALSLIGTLLVYSATQPGADPRAYLTKQLLNVFLGLILMVVVSLLDYRRLRIARADRLRGGRAGAAGRAQPAGHLGQRRPVLDHAAGRASRSSRPSSPRSRWC